MRADHAAADHDHARRRHARHAAEQQALAAGRLAQRKRSRFDREPARDLAHRRQQRQAAALVGDGLVGHRRAARFEQAVRLLGVRREVQIGEEDLPLAQHLPFARLRLLDLDDHLGRGEDLGRAADDARTGGHVVRIAGADAGTRPRLHDQLVAVARIFTHRHRREADTMFLDLDFLGHPDAHDSLRRH